MQRGEGGKLVEELVGCVDRLGILAADGVEEAVLLGQQTWRHAWVHGEDDEAEEVRQGHHASSLSKLGVCRRGVVVPCEEAVHKQVRQWFSLTLREECVPDCDGNVNQRIGSVEDGQHRLVIVPEEGLDIDLA